MIRALSISVGAWLACALVAGGEPALDPVVADTRHQVPLAADTLRIPISGPVDPANFGLALVGVKMGDRTVPTDGWGYCLNAPDAAMPLHTLNVTWPASVTSGDLDLSFAVWDRVGGGTGTCDAPANGTPLSCTTATCPIEVIQIAIGATGPMLHIAGTLTRTLTFDDAGAPEPLMVPAAPTPWAGEGKTMHLRIVEETHDTAPGPARFDMCLTRTDGVPSGITVKPLDATVPVGKTVLKAHLWMGTEHADEDCASAAPADAAAYDPAACGTDGAGASSACQEVSLTLVRTQATFDPPTETPLIRHVSVPFLDRVLSPRHVAKDHWQTELGLTTSGHAIELDGALRADLTDGTGARTDGYVRLYSDGGNVLKGGTSRAFQIELDPPDGYGSFDANISLSGVSGTMATAVLPIKVLISMPWWIIPLVIVVGTLLGYGVRSIIENRVPMLEARKKAREVADVIVARAGETPDLTLQSELRAKAKDLRNGLHDGDIKAEALQKLVTTSEQEVTTVLEKHAERLTNLRADLTAWRKALDVDGDLPEPVAGSVQGMADALNAVKENLDAENATGASTALSAATGPAKETARQYRDWLESDIAPLPGLAGKLGDYTGVTSAEIDVTGALAAANADSVTGPGGFGAMLGHSRPLIMAQRAVQVGLSTLLNELADVLEKSTLEGYTPDLRVFYAELDAAQSAGLDHAKIDRALAALTSVLPAMVNSTANWQALNAGEMPDGAVSGDTGAVLSRFRQMMVRQRDGVSNQADMPFASALSSAAATVKTPSRMGYYLRRPKTIQFGEDSHWMVESEDGFEAPSSVDWRVNGQLAKESGLRHLIHHGQNDVLEVAATLKFEGRETEITLHTRVLPTGLRGWDNVTAINKRLRNARRLRTLVSGLLVVAIGTYTLNTVGANMASVVTAFLLGFGADLTANSIKDLSDKITAT